MSGEQVDVDLLRQEGQTWLSNFGDDWPGLIDAADEIVRLRAEVAAQADDIGRLRDEAICHRALVNELREEAVFSAFLGLFLARHGFGGDA